MWWNELTDPAGASGLPQGKIHDDAYVSPHARIIGAVSIGARTRICPGAHIEGPVVIAEDCLIGNNTMIRGSTRIDSGVQIGFSSEVKNAIIERNVTIGPQCFVANSKIETGSYLGAQVRTSNHRLDKRAVWVEVGDMLIDTGKEKLGCLVGANSRIGVQVVILPGRIVAPASMFAPRITIEKNLPAGRYRIRQQIESF